MSPKLPQVVVRILAQV